MGRLLNNGLRLPKHQISVRLQVDHKQCENFPFVLQSVACETGKSFQDRCFYCNFSLCALPEISHYGDRCDQLQHAQPMRDRDVHCKVITVAVHLIATVTQRIA